MKVIYSAFRHDDVFTIHARKTDIRAFCGQWIETPGFPQVMYDPLHPDACLACNQQLKIAMKEGTLD